MSEREGFLARWSRQKAGLARPADAPSAPSPPTQQGPAEAAAARETAAAETAAQPLLPAAAEAAPPLPTLADVAALTRESDYSRFMATGVDGSVRNAALKKLFSDPHFNVMDGLDTYIDDYNKPDPLPLSMLRAMRQSETLGLFRDEAANAPEAAAQPEACPDGAATAPVAPSPSDLPPTEASSRAEEDPDLRLQPDDADRRAGAGEGPRS